MKCEKEKEKEKEKESNWVKPKRAAKKLFC